MPISPAAGNQVMVLEAAGSICAWHPAWIVTYNSGPDTADLEWVVFPDGRIGHPSRSIESGATTKTLAGAAHNSATVKWYVVGVS